MIYIAADHKGFEVERKLEKYLRSLNYSFTNEGPHKLVDGDDYPDYAKKVCEKITENDKGILVCDTGIGMSIAANRNNNIRAALCSSIYDAVKTREDNDANVLALGAHTTDLDTIKSIVKAFLETPFSNEERHIRRINKL